MEKMDAGWSDVYKKDPGRAIQILLDTADYVVPRLQRMELKNPEGEEFMIKIDGANGN